MKFYNVLSGTLSGKTREAYIRNIENRVFNSIHSYCYLRGYDDEKIIEDNMDLEDWHVIKEIKNELKSN